MKRFSEQLHKKATTTVKLQAAEKRELRERLISYMEYHPLPAELKSKATKKSSAKVATPLVTDAFTMVKIPFITLFKTTAVAAAVVLVVVPLMAQRAMPGDVLYAVKVEFNEEVVSTLTFDSYKKIERETELLNRRIAEARLLDSEGRLTDEVEADVAEAVKTHTENAQREIAELRTHDADGAAIASIEFDATLSAQSTSLREDDETTKGSDDTNKVSLIAGVIDESRTATEDYVASSSLPAYDKLMARVEQNTTRIYELVDTISTVTPEPEMTDVMRRLEDINRSIAESTELKVTDSSAAQTLLVDVLQRAQKLIVYITELTVNQTVDIETVVPVVLTDDEKNVIIADLTKSVNEKKDIVTGIAETLEDDEILEKVAVSLDAITELSDQLATTTDFSSSQTLADEAMEIADDIIATVKHNQALDEVIETDSVVETASTSADGVPLEVETGEPATTTDEVIEENTESVTESATTEAESEITESAEFYDIATGTSDSI